MKRTTRGQASLEFVITFGAVTLPATVAIIFTAQLLWVWHSMVEFTRQGAQYAATHCYQSNGQNVVNYMQMHLPPTIDQQQFGAGGSAVIDVRYFGRNPETGQLEDFQCAAAECSTECVPDAVTVRVTGYSFDRVLRQFGVAPVPLPDFRTSMPIESAGCSAGGDGVICR